MQRRILLLITDLEIGGTPTVVRELAIRLRQPGKVHIAVACLSKWGPVADLLHAAQIDVTAFGATSVSALPGVVRRLVRLIHLERFDTVFSFLIHANATAALASCFCPGVRFLQSIQTTQPYPRWHWKLQRLVGIQAERMVVPSASAASVARSRAGIPADRIIVIPNAVDANSFNELWNRPARASAICNVGFIGRLDPVKRVPDLLEAMAGIPLTHVHVFGEGSDRPRIAAIIARLRLSDSVTLYGTIARPQEALAQIDLLVLPSQAEGFGLVLIEAMAAGVPVIGTDVPGICDVIKNGVTGVLVAPRCPEAIRAAVLALEAKPQWRDAMVAEARADVIRRFSWETVIEGYQHLLGLNEARPRPAQPALRGK